jgi:hypothetical protein
LQGFSSELPQVQALIDTLGVKIEADTRAIKKQLEQSVVIEEFNDQSMANALYGLQRLHSEHKETRKLLSAVAERFMLHRKQLANTSQNERVISGTHVASALYGFQHMNVQHVEVRNLLAAVNLFLSSRASSGQAQTQSIVVSDLEGRHIGGALYGLRSLSADCLEVRQLLAILNKILRTHIRCHKRRHADTATPKPMLHMKEQEIGSAFYGLQNMSSRHAEVCELVSLLTDVLASNIHASSARKDKGALQLSSQAIHNALYGLKSLHSEHGEVRRLLPVLHDLIVDVPDTNTHSDSHSDKCTNFAIKSRVNLRGHEIGSALYGLQHMSSEHEEVGLLLSAITATITPTHTVSTQTHNRPLIVGRAIGNALYGLRNMNSNNKQVQQLIHALTQTIRTQLDVDPQQLHMNRQEIANALYGLQEMRSECEEVRELLSVLCTVFRLSTHSSSTTQSSAILDDGRDIGIALYGLQNLSSDHGEVRRLLTVLNTNIATGKILMNRINGRHIGNALYGLQRMSSEHEEVRDLMETLAVKLTHALEVSALDVASALYGLQQMNCKSVEVTHMLAVLTEAINHTNNTGDNHDGVSAVKKCVFENGQQLGNAIFGLRRMHSYTLEVLELVNALATMIPSYADISPQNQQNQENQQARPRVNDVEIYCIACGMQHWDCGEVSVRRLIAALAPIVVDSCTSGMSDHGTNHQRILAVSQFEKIVIWLQGLLRTCTVPVDTPATGTDALAGETTGISVRACHNHLMNMLVAITTRYCTDDIIEETTSTSSIENDNENENNVAMKNVQHHWKSQIRGLYGL